MASILSFIEAIRSERGLYWVDRSMGIVALLGAVSLGAQIGFAQSPGILSLLHFFDALIFFLFTAEVLLALVLTRERHSHLKERAVEMIILCLTIATLFMMRLVEIRYSLGNFWDFVQVPRQSPYLLSVQSCVGALILVRGIRLNRALILSRLSPTQAIIVSFAAVILLGTLLLYVPQSAAPGRKIALVDALFTSTSAVCVTGLICLDTPNDFSLTGQLVIMLLMQAGGLGIMTFASAFALILGKGMGLRERAAMQDVLSSQAMGRVTQLLVTIVITTLIVEALGAVALYFTLGQNIEHPGGRIFVSVFHSIAAFCNSGFSTFSDNLMGPQATLFSHYVIATLIILGGLGFVVLSDLGMGFRRLLRKEPVWRRFSLQSKIVLTSSAALILGGAACIGLLSAFAPDGQFRGMSPWLIMHHALFQSISARTAGFNTIDLNDLGEAANLAVMGLMFIGASPGSTGGGIKTVTFVVILAVIFSIVGRRPNAELGGRRLPQSTIHGALAVTFCAAFLVLGSIFALTLTDPHIEFTRLAFEEISAFGTVGLSRGATLELSTMGKIIIIFNMFIGRIGPLTLILATGRRRETVRITYPEEQVMIG